MRPPVGNRPSGHVVLACLVLAAVLLQGCAARPYRPPPVEPLLSRDLSSGRTAPFPAGGGEGLVPQSRRSHVAEARAGVVEAASGMVGAAAPSAQGRRFRADCSGYVQAVYAQAGIDLYADAGASGSNGVAIIARYVAERGGLHGRRPLPGDIVFFDGTHGPPGSRLTHTGIVEGVEADGTVVFLHHMQGRVVRSRMNRYAPTTHQDPDTGRIINDYLRRGSDGPRLAGELFAGYGTVVR
jgi:peptidoglycan DL-endopeptidase CwlO